MVTVERIGVGVVIRPQFDPAARPFDTITDEQWDQAWEQPMRATITALQAAYRSGAQRIVVVVPTIGMSGGAQYAHVAATAEAIRVLVKSAARQWGNSGVTVNALALAALEFIDDPAIAGPVSIAPAALGNIEIDASATIAFLCSEAAGHVTGQTLTVDGGTWM